MNSQYEFVVDVSRNDAVKLLREAFTQEQFVQQFNIRGGSYYDDDSFWFEPKSTPWHFLFMSWPFRGPHIRLTGGFKEMASGCLFQGDFQQTLSMRASLISALILAGIMMTLWLLRQMTLPVEITIPLAVYTVGGALFFKSQSDQFKKNVRAFLSDVLV